MRASAPAPELNFSQGSLANACTPSVLSGCAARRWDYKIKSVLRKLECLRVTISWMMSRLSTFDWAATNERMEKQRKASLMESVASAESFLGHGCGCGQRHGACRSLLAVKSAKYFAGFGIDTLHLYNFRFPIQILYGRK